MKVIGGSSEPYPRIRVVSSSVEVIVLPTEHQQVIWDDELQQDLAELVRFAIREDLQRLQDWTTVSLVDAGAVGKASAVSREDGVVAGMLVGQVVLDEIESDVQWHPLVEDGASVVAGTTLARVKGPARDILTAERTILNIMGRLCGVATLTRKYVDAVAETKARVCDTRKTTPAWRRAEKFAVRCGGGLNHRIGLYDAVLIKDNHIAFCGEQARVTTPADAVRRSRAFVANCDAIVDKSKFIIEIEVDAIEQLKNVLPAKPDIVLLDNMSIEQLSTAVKTRDDVAPSVALEASGGVNLQTVLGIAKTGVERISVGALTHSSPNFDIGLDWQ